MLKLRIWTVVFVALGFLALSVSLGFFPLYQRSMVLMSPVFKNGERIPSKYTCDGENISPPLSWSGAPAGTKSFALIVDDLDAPPRTTIGGEWAGGVTHWVIFNIPASAAGLRENEGGPRKFPGGAVVIIEGQNDFSHIGYSGPCPPSGVHRYWFHLYALDTWVTLLPLSYPVAKQDLLNAMEGHRLAEAELVGLYSRG